MSLRRILLPALSVLVLMPGAAFAQPTVASTANSAPAVAPTSPVSSAPTIANFLPIDTAGVLLINTTAEAWESLSRFGLFPKDMSFPGALYPTELGINFSTDVQPWLGEQMAIALLPANAVNKQVGNRSLIIASVKDATQLPRFLERLKTAKKKAAIEHQYKGITILEWQPEKSTPCEPSKQSVDPVTFAPKQQASNGNQRLAACQAQTVKQLLTTAIKPFQSATEPKAQTMQAPSLPAPVPETPLPEKTPEQTTFPFAPQGFAIAILPNYVVTSTTVGAIAQLIDAQAAGKPLADNPLFQRTAQKPQFAKSLIAGYGEYMQIFAASTAFNQEQFKNLPPGMILPKIDPQTLDVLAKYYDTIDGYVWAEPDGMHMQVGVQFKEAIPQTLLDSMATPNQILERLPEVNYMMSNSQNLAMYWQALTTGLEAEPTLKKYLDQFRQSSQAAFGLDDRDIFPWMNREYVSFLYPTRQGFIPAAFPNLDLGFGMMIQTRDRPKAEAALTKLDQVARTRIGKEVVVTRKLQGQPVTTWEGALQGKTRSFLSHSWVDEDTVLLLMGGGAVTEFSPKPTRTLPQSTNFKAAIAPLTESNLGYFYVNNGAVMTLVNNSLLPLFGAGKTEGVPFVDELKATLGSIRSLSGASSIKPDKIQSDGFLALATTRTVAIAPSELLELGQTKLLAGNADGAIENFTRVLKLEPTNDEAYAQRGDARLQTEDTRGAIADYTQALQINPKNAETYQGRANAYSALFDYQKSLEDWNQAIQLNPDVSESYVARSEVRASLEDFKGAIADTDQAIRLYSEDSVAYNNRCYSRARGLSDFKGALADCEKAIELNAESPDNYASRCYVRANLGDKKALEDCNLALEIDPEYPPLYENRGLAHAALGNKKAALADLQKAAELFKQQGNGVAQQRIEKVIKGLK